MEKRGRPRKNGEQPIWMLDRVTLVVYAYDQAREAGEKHMAAITEAVEFIRENRPWIESFPNRSETNPGELAVKAQTGWSVGHQARSGGLQVDFARWADRQAGVGRRVWAASNLPSSERSRETWEGP